MSSSFYRDEGDKRDKKKMLHDDLTSEILKACFEVSNELGVGYIESVYENALFVALVRQSFRNRAKLQ